MNTFPIHSIFISLIFCGILTAQDVDPAPMRQLQQGDRALQFAVRGLFNLGSFQGSTISYKRHSSPKTGWRMGLDVYLNSSVSDGSEERDMLSTRTDYPDLTGYQRTEDETYSLRDEDENLSVDIIIQWIRYPAARGELQPYWGIGPIAHISGYNSEYESLSTDTTADPRISRRKTSTYGLGVSGVFGLEWFFRNNMSLTAEYCPYFRTNYSIDKRYTKTTRNNVYYDQDGEMDQWRTEISEVESEIKSSQPGLSIRSQMKLGLSLYF